MRIKTYVLFYRRYEIDDPLTGPSGGGSPLMPEPLPPPVDFPDFFHPATAVDQYDIGYDVVEEPEVENIYRPPPLPPPGSGSGFSSNLEPNRYGSPDVPSQQKPFNPQNKFKPPPPPNGGFKGFFKPPPPPPPKERSI